MYIKWYASQKHFFSIGTILNKWNALWEARASLASYISQQSLDRALWRVDNWVAAVINLHLHSSGRKHVRGSYWEMLSDQYVWRSVHIWQLGDCFFLSVIMNFCLLYLTLYPSSPSSCVKWCWMLDMKSTVELSYWNAVLEKIPAKHFSINKQKTNQYQHEDWQMV